MAGADVYLDGAGVEAYASVPDGASRGVVVIGEVFGRQPEIDRVVDRFAAAGYAAVAPDLFGKAPRALCITRMMRVELTGRGRYASIVRAVRDWLVERAGVDRRCVGIIGFCVGGGFALACGSAFGAISANYGMTPPRRVLEGSPPVIACFGGRDRVFRGEADVLRRRLMALSVPHEVHVFEHAGHSFLTDGDHPIASFLTRPLMNVGYDPTSADEAWGHIQRFFDTQLAPLPPS